MQCSRCGKCCKKTEMELLNSDVRRLATLGFKPEEFISIHEGIPRLKNVNGFCYFYNVSKRECKIYSKRPLGCRVYPVIYVEGVGPSIDKLCPMWHTVSYKEFKIKARILRKILNRLNEERRKRLIEGER
ncbi:MAG: YkgJ family cysteine cluster protein [Candidatus Bathyarchaeia archaeon]